MTTLIAQGPLERMVSRLVSWWNGRGIPAGPQPCQHCGVKTVRGWVECFGDGERFFVEHGDPVCFAGSKRLEIFPLTEVEIRAFRYWTANVEFRGGAAVAPSAGTES